MARKTRKSERLDVNALEAAHVKFRALAGKETRKEVRAALNEAAHITHTLLLAVAAASDLSLVLDITIGGRRGTAP
jgi:hypothetical protein